MEYFFSEKKLERTLGTRLGRFSGTASPSKSRLKPTSHVTVWFLATGLWGGENARNRRMVPPEADRAAGAKKIEC